MKVEGKVFQEEGTASEMILWQERTWIFKKVNTSPVYEDIEMSN